jgi:hypothetical protein
VFEGLFKGDPLLGVVLEELVYEILGLVGEDDVVAELVGAI